jgi:hypothetical protein
MSKQAWIGVGLIWPDFATNSCLSKTQLSFEVHTFSKNTQQVESGRGNLELVQPGFQVSCGVHIS